MDTFFKDKRILVTGGTGSIGSEIVRQLLAFEPAVVRVFSRSEHTQHLMSGAHHGRKLRFLLGDVRDVSRLAMAVKDVDIVFHAAALKQVPVCEYNPFEAVKTNVIGTQNLIEVCMNAEVSRVIAISTDKAVSPINTMGATKLLGERLITSANLYRGRRDITLASVRFGNVIGSRGSVIPTFARQIRAGGPVTVTHKKMTRFFMTISEAVSLVLQAGMAAAGGEVFILKMPVFRITDLIDILIKELAPKYGHDPKSIKIESIGLRAGERLYEELLTREEGMYTRETENMYILNPMAPALAEPPEFSYNSHDQAPISKKKLHEILSREGIFSDSCIFDK